MYYPIGIEIKFFQRSFIYEYIRWYIIKITVIELQFTNIFFLSSQACGALPPSTTHFMNNWNIEVQLSYILSLVNRYYLHFFSNGISNYLKTFTIVCSISPSNNQYQLYPKSFADHKWMSIFFSPYRSNKEYIFFNHID